MNRTRSYWVTTGLVAVIAVLATLLVVTWAPVSPRVALGQVSEGAQANYTIALLGVPFEDRTPLFMIDTKAQTVLVYEYIQSRRLMFLRVARSYMYDRELKDNGFGQNNIYEGPTVDQVRNTLRGGR